MKKLFILFTLFLFYTSAFSQVYKVQLTEGCVIMKDSAYGGIYDLYDWKKTNAVLWFDTSKDTVFLKENGNVIEKFYLTEVVKTLVTGNEVTYIFKGMETSQLDNFQKPINGSLKINLIKEERAKRSVLIFESEYTLLFFRGGVATKQ